MKINLTLDRILRNHSNCEAYELGFDEGCDSDLSIGDLREYDTEELVALVKLIDEELQNRDLPTAQEIWENEGGVGVG